MRLKFFYEFNVTLFERLMTADTVKHMYTKEKYLVKRALLFFLVYICKEVIVSCSAPLMWVIV